jgi:hypothetical protein
LVETFGCSSLTAEPLIVPAAERNPSTNTIIISTDEDAYNKDPTTTVGYKISPMIVRLM